MIKLIYLSFAIFFLIAVAGAIGMITLDASWVDTCRLLLIGITSAASAAYASFCGCRAALFVITKSLLQAHYSMLPPESQS